MLAHVTLQQLIQGAEICVNKPLRWTSHDVVNKIKITFNSLKIKNEKGELQKIKIGHAGTLDPLATGVLVICTGAKTKTIDTIQLLPKTYLGTFTFGATTPSYDLEYEPDTFYNTQHINEQAIKEAMRAFTGPIAQVPPPHSAVKIDGKRAYKSARAGIDIAMPTKHVTVHSFELRKYAMPQVEVEVQCSKGTYIRSLAHDIGQHLQSGAYLSSLCRTSVGHFHLEHAWPLDAFIEHITHHASLQATP